MLWLSSCSGLIMAEDDVQNITHFLFHPGCNLNWNNEYSLL